MLKLKTEGNQGTLKEALETPQVPENITPPHTHNIIYLYQAPTG